MVVPDQFIDRTRRAPRTFFGDGLGRARGVRAIRSARDLGARAAGGRARPGRPCTRGGTYVCIEGPQFSTRAESRALPVVGHGRHRHDRTCRRRKLAREAEICYATLALVTDYDCWHPGHDAVTVEQVIATCARTSRRRRDVLRAAVRSLPRRRARAASARSALLARARHRAGAGAAARSSSDLAPIIGKYIE